MNLTIASLMHREVYTAAPDDTLQSVEAKLVSNGLSWVPVVDGGNVLGVISSTDLLRHHAGGMLTPKVSAWQLCTYKPVTVRPDATLREVARLMIESNIHHVVVMDGNDIKGVVSALDFVQTFVD
ncbi:HPP family protein [Polaromonas sp. A23]|uniref:CBS domain-containing protein n=1 Tax=Polaromonas sp. A23 TaxID=1944133 RepID=UPI0009879D78|nr:CBS domain-containing protein [Polaromonas sp. A23]OOG42981.1 signal transduction protein [Polaromonas sp. A23]